MFQKIHTPIEGPPVDGPALAPLQVPKVDFGGLMGNGFSTFLLVSACLGLRPLLFLIPFSLDLIGREANVPKKKKKIMQQSQELIMYVSNVVHHKVSDKKKNSTRVIEIELPQNFMGIF